MRRLAPVLVSIVLIAATPVRADPFVFSWLLARAGQAPIARTSAHATSRLPQLRRRFHGRAAAQPARARSFSSPAGSSRDLFDLVTAAARRHGIPVRLAHAIVRIESGYRCHAANRSGARGIMQVLPRTAASVGVAGDLLDCATGLEAGMRYLGRAIRAGGAGCAGASLYNRGLGAAPRCTGYGRSVMAAMGTATP